MSDDEKDKDTAAPQLAEVTAMQKLVTAFTGLEPDSIGRVLRWAADTYKVSVSTTSSGKGHAAGSSTTFGAAEPGNGNGNGRDGATQFSDLAELFAATSPESDADRVLVAGYWAQFGDGRQEITSQEINTALKNLGHPIKNITSAFDTLKARKPAPVMQLKKSGTSRQARKTYKLTVAGKNSVELMIGQH